MENNTHPLLKNLNEEQQKAVSFETGPMLVLAGAGSGKTRVLTNRIAYLIAEKRVPAFRILAMTFTNKAAKEMKERIEQLISMDVQQFWIGTFHSVFARILRIEAKALGYTSNYTIYDTSDQESVMKRIMESHSINTKNVSPKKIRAKISSLKNKMITPKQFDEIHSKKDAFDQVVSKVYWEYGVRLRHNNAMDFDDLLNNTIKLFKENPEILEKYQHKFDHILIDEYQDTNVAQFEIIKMLGEKHRNVCVVGDDDQSIYKWRGAEVKNVLNYADSFPDKTTFRLEQNYRSTPQILEIANSLIQHNQSRLEKELWTKNPAGDKPMLYTLQNPRQEA
ncbi:MAG: UvrD-helicase domain-containing protein, partial [Calditrichia bacterium]|nr:UvrD-helicase domain-containing protein [Calditrichia bacterium]